MVDLVRDLDEYEHAEHIRRMVAEHPPLTQAQRDRLRLILSRTNESRSQEQTAA
jgi:hypothetical protein